LKFVVPDLGASTSPPAKSVEVGNGYALLKKEDRYHQAVLPTEEKSLQHYLTQSGIQVPDSSQLSVLKWAHLLLPNGQEVQSFWKEEKEEISGIHLTSG
jgi:hypothetical protein